MSAAEQLEAARGFREKVQLLNGRYEALNVELVALMKSCPHDPHFFKNTLAEMGLTETEFLSRIKPPVPNFHGNPKLN